MLNVEMKKWIDEASYEELLRKWRFASHGESFFRGEMGDYYSKVLSRKMKEVGNSAAVAASKSIGW